MKATPAQHAMWLNERLGIAGAVYHMPMTVEFGGPLDRERMLAACEAVVAKHPALRQSFVERDGILYVVDDAEPLFRFELSGHWLTIVAHHLVFDGQSKDILLRDLAHAYNRPAEPLPARPQGTPVVPPQAPPDDTRVPLETGVQLPGLRAVAAKAVPGEFLDFTVTHSHPAFTRFELLLAGLVALLTRYGNAEPMIAIDLGTRRPEDAGRIGLFVNELPFLPKARTALEVIPQARDMYRLRNVALQGPPRVAVAPVSISYRKRSAAPVFEGLEAEIEWMGFNGWARNALHVQVVDDSHAAEVRFQFGPSQIDREDMARIAEHYRKLLNAIAKSPDTPFEDLPMLTEGELTHVEGPVRDFPSERIDAQIAGEGIAVTGSGSELSYAGLDRAAEAVALRLRDRGVRPGDRVAVRMHRSPELVAALLGVWKAGAAYVPLDPEHPPARQSLLLSDARPRAVVTAEEVIGLEWSGAPEPSLAYVIYTSGSTGRPKGVEVEHRSVSNLLHGLREVLDLAPRPVWLSLASYAFDMSVPELWLPLITGGTVVMATEDEARDAERLLKLIRAKSVTHVHVTPSTWQRLLEAGFDEPGVVAISGAEALPESVARQVRQRSARLWNLYGPTEATVWATAAEVGEEPVTIGRPLPNQAVKIADAAMRPVPQGIPGELCIGGAGVARGYHGQPELTAQRFVDGWYRTGDRVRLRPDGQLEWLGRLDDQIKIRGYRIELGEIEARLLEHPGVRAAAAAAHDGDTLVAYVVGEAPDLRDHMAEVLPAYQVPAKYVFLPELPLNSNGKLDRARLPKPPPAPAGEALDGVAKQIYEVWCDVLGRRDFGPDDDLFDLGGHSLTVTRIAARMRRHLGIDLPLHVFFDSPTINGILITFER